MHVDAADRRSHGQDESPDSFDGRRAVLLVAARKFLDAAVKLHGIERIAIIGSITTSKLEPKDIDLLVTVADDMDLAPLATISRRLMGGLQSQSSGADVFLADLQGRYIGRVCQWRECAPGIRRGCDAWNCGRRHYLHDDFGSIRLASSLVRAPAVTIWPRLSARVPLPEDLAAMLAEWSPTQDQDTETEQWP